MSTATRVVKNTGYLYAKMGITMFISLYTTRLILNSLGASDFGVFNIVGGSIAMLGFLNAAMASATQRFMSYAEGAGEKEKQKVIFNVSVILHLLIAVCVGIILEIAYCFFFNGILNIPEDRIFAAKCIYHFMVISTMFTITTVPYDAVLNAHENMLYYSIVGIFESILKLCAAFVVVYALSDKLIIYGALMASISLIVMIIKRIYCHKHYIECVFAPRLYFEKQQMKKMTSFAGWNSLTSFVAIVSNYGQGIIMNLFFGTLVNAAQGISNQVCGQLLSISTILRKAVAPIIVKREGANQHDKVIKMSCILNKVFFFSISIIALPTIFLTPQILNIWLGNVPDYTIFFIRCQLIISMLEHLSIGTNMAINANGNIRSITLTKSLFKVVYLPIIYILFKLNYSPISSYVLLVMIQGVINGTIVAIYYSHKIVGYDALKYVKVLLLPATYPMVIVLSVYILMLNLFDYTYIKYVAVLTCTVLFIVLGYRISFNKEEKSVLFTVYSEVRYKLNGKKYKE